MRVLETAHETEPAVLHCGKKKAAPRRAVGGPCRPSRAGVGLVSGGSSGAMMSLLRNDVVIVVVGQLFQQAITMLTGVIIARELAASGFGVANLLRSVFVALATIAPLGLDLALLKYCGRQDLPAARVARTVRRLRVTAAAAATAVALVVALGFGGWLMRDVYRIERFDLMLLVTVAALPFAADLGIMSALYKAEGRPGAYALMTIYLQPVFRLAAVVGVVSFAPTPMAIIAVNTAQVLISAAAVTLHRRLTPFATRNTEAVAASEQGADVVKVLGELLWMALNLFVYGMMRFVDILLLGCFAPTNVVGEYAALSTISQIVQVYPLAVSQTLGPTISRRHHAGDAAGVRSALDDYIYLASLVSGFVFGGVAAFGTRLDLLFGASFHFAPAVSFLMPLGYLLSATLAPTGYALSMTGRHRSELAILFLGGMALAIGCLALVPRFGQTGAALSVAAAFLLINVARFAYVAKVLAFVPGRLADFAGPLAGLALAFLSRAIADGTFARNFAGLAAGCAIYTALYGALCATMLLRPQHRRRLAPAVDRWSAGFIGRGARGDA